MTRGNLVLIVTAFTITVGAAAVIRPAGGESAEATCEEESIATTFGELECWIGRYGPVAVFSTQSQTDARALASVASEALETARLLFGTTIDQFEHINLVVWPTDRPSPLAALPERLEGDSVYLVAGGQTNDVRSAISDIVIDRAASPHQDQVPLWLRVALRHWIRGGNQSATLDRVRKIATDPLYAYDRYFSLTRLESWPLNEAYQQIYVGQSLAMLAWLLQDWPPEALGGMFTKIAQGDSFEQSVLDTYELSSDSFVSAFAAEAPRITQLSWPYTERPQWHAWFTTSRIAAISIAGVASLVLARFWWWLRRPVDLPRRRSGLEWRRYLPRSGSIRF